MLIRGGTLALLTRHQDKVTLRATAGAARQVRRASTTSRPCSVSGTTQSRDVASTSVCASCCADCDVQTRTAGARVGSAHDGLFVFDDLMIVQGSGGWAAPA